MFGQNPPRPLEQHLPGGALRLQEIFYTIQGEGPYSGVPCIFIRLAGCNLRCHFCDTEFESGYENKQSLAHIIKAVDFTCEGHPERRKLVVLTGGEPLIQNVVPLIDALIQTGTQLVQIETAGTTWVPGLEEQIKQEQALLVCSPKTKKVNQEIQRHCRHWKYVIAEGEVDPADGLPNTSTQRLRNRGEPEPSLLYRPPVGLGRGDTIWVSPQDSHVGDDKNARNVAQAVQSAMDHGQRLSLQTHKIVFLP